MPWLIAFLAGFLSTLIFHQGVIGAFSLLELAAVRPFDFHAVPPFGVPKVISLAFWGGVWGLPIWWLVRRWHGMRYWLGSVVAGAVGPTAVAMLVVFPLKGLAVSGKVVAGGLLANGAWGFGVALIMYPVLRKLAQAANGAGGDGSSPD